MWGKKRETLLKKGGSNRETNRRDLQKRYCLERESSGGANSRVKQKE